MIWSHDIKFYTIEFIVKFKHILKRDKTSTREKDSQK